MKRAPQRMLLGLVLGSALLGLARPVEARGVLRATAFAAEGEGERKGADHELLFKTINFLILAGALGFVLRKPLAQFFTGRSAAIQKGLEEGRKALEASQAQLRAVEEKLQRLGEEIEAFKAFAAREMEAEQQRLREAAAEDAARLLESSRAQMTITTRAAQLELKAFTAQQAVALASEVIRQRLDAAGRERLVSQFAAMLGESRKES